MNLAEMPARLEQMNGRGPALTVSRAALANLRRGGVLNATRTIQRAFSEITTYFSPASTVAEVPRRPSGSGRP